MVILFLWWFDVYFYGDFMAIYDDSNGDLWGMKREILVILWGIGCDQQ